MLVIGIMIFMFSVMTIKLKWDIVLSDQFKMIDADKLWVFVKDAYI